jgi:hypothetical protein
MKQALQSKTALDLAIELAQQFHHNDHGWIEAVNQVKPNWITRADHQLSIGELVREYLDIERLIGVGFGKTTKYAVIDLDWSSNYHPAHDFSAYFKILHTLESIGLTRYVVIQSSYSRGLHIYFPLSHPVKTFELAAAIRVALIKAGFQPKNGQLEIFPNTKRYASASGDYSHYNLHRMPLLPNSGSWLMEDDGLSPQPIFDGLESQLSAFLDQWEMAAAGQDLELLTRKLPQLYATFKKSKRKYQPQSDEDKSVKAAQWFADLKLSIQIGWTERGQTYNLMPQFLAYGVVFLGLEGDELYQWMYQSIVNAPGYQQHCQHQHEIEKMIRSWIKTNERTGYYSPYRSEPDRSQPYPFGNRKLKAKIVRKPHTANIKRSDEAASRIKVAYENIKDRFTAETTITQMRDQLRAEIQAKYGVGIGTNTLSRHKNIWHPEHNLGDNTSPTEKNEQSPGTLTDKDLSECIDTPKIDIKPTQTHAQSQEYYSQIPMIGVGDLDPVSPDLTTDPSQTSFTQPHSLGSELVLEVEQDLTNYTKHYNLPPNEVVTRKPGKFEVLGGALSKIATLAALVVNMMAGVKLVGVASPSENLEPTIAAETALPPVTLEVMTEIVPPSSATTPIDAGEVPLRPCDGAVRERFSSTPPLAATFDRPSESIAMVVEPLPVSPEARLRQRTASVEPNRSPLEPPKPPAQVKTPSAEIGHHHGRNCPKCQISTPLSELERWEMCRFCATKILFKRKQ